MVSYGQIIRVVLRIKSTGGQRKAFGTNPPHGGLAILLAAICHCDSWQHTQISDNMALSTCHAPHDQPSSIMHDNRDVKGAKEEGAWKDSDSRWCTGGQFNGKTWTPERSDITVLMSWSGISLITLRRIEPSFPSLHCPTWAHVFTRKVSVQFLSSCIRFNFQRCWFSVLTAFAL